MEVVKLNANEVKALETELFGFYSNESKEVFKGVLSQKIPFKLKFWLETHLVKQIQKASKSINAKIKEIAISTECVIDDVKGIIDFEKTSVENKELYKKELDNFIKEDIDILFSVELSYFENLEFEEHYPILMKFVKDNK